MRATRNRVLLVVVAAAGGCAAYPTTTAAPIDCTVESAFTFDPTPVDTSTTFPAWDMTAGSSASAASAPIPGGALCGAGTAFEIQAEHCNDWGALVGFYMFTGLGYRDESAYEGVSFWARAPGPTNKSFTLALDDANTVGGKGGMDAGVNCTDYGQDGGLSNPTGTVYDPSTNMPISGVTTAAPPPNACGNSYSTVMIVTEGWRFYTVPFTQLHQSPMPNRVPNSALMQTGSVPGSGLLTSRLMNMTFRLPREATTDLWIAKLNFYRTASGTSGDAGVAAP